jgi:Spy/CpxP family protein refolding chaperone
MQRGAMQRADRALFKGIDLSSAQKTQLDSVRSKFRNESRSLREQMAPEMKSARAARQSGDSAKIAEVRQSMAASRAKMTELRKQEMAEVRGVLTPEQQSTFDSNVKTMQDRMQHARESRRGRRAGAPTGATGQ